MNKGTSLKKKNMNSCLPTATSGIEVLLPDGDAFLLMEITSSSVPLKMTMGNRP